MSFKKFFKKFIIYFSLIILISVGISLIYSYIPKTLESFDNRLRDYMFVLRGEQPDSNNVVIVDLDDKSLKEIGQWPWSRDIVSDMLINLTNANVGLIAFDIVFAEKDRSNPSDILNKLNIKTDKEIPNYDNIFASVVAQTPTILGYQFQLSKDDFKEIKSPDIPAMFIEKNRDEYNKNMVIEAYGTILNIPLVQDNAYSSGFFNNVPDESGVVRSVPLIIRYDDQLYPSLALEVIRAISDKRKVYINYDENGVSDIEVGDYSIPTDRYGRNIVNFRGSSKTFKYISASDIINNSFNPKDIEGKIVLIGTSAAGLLDLRATPFESVYPGVEVHANVIDNILTENFISKPSWVDGLNLFHIFILAFVLLLLVAYLPLWLALIFIIFISVADMYMIFVVLFEHGLILNILFPILTIFASVISAMTLNYFLETKQTKAIKGKFASKVSKEVMESLLANPDDDSFSAMSKEITVFFSDVRNFTNISEAMPSAKVLIEFLNEYMDPMTDIIIKEHGTVDKFIGDAIMAYWNAPGNVPDHANRALIATMEQLHLLDSLNIKIKADERFKAVCEMSAKNGVEPIEIGIGLNTGVAIAGEMGSSQRSDYTVIGDPVNLGARLESLCKHYNSLCNISNFTKEQLPQDDYIFRFLDLVTVKGKKEPIEIWQVIDYNKKNPEHTLYKVSRERLDEELSLYNKAIILYKDAEFKEALEIFIDIDSWEDKTNKNIYKMYIERCEHYIAEPPVDFNGVFVHTTKG
ncbi:MAG: adenylate/guanylate cyclase domain-containing protein [Campylobacterota bacterium]|nr:adenylate/guanylate cyclase domain-containing protein [Campylobacterota bacterium]